MTVTELVKKLLSIPNHDDVVIGVIWEIPGWPAKCIDRLDEAGELRVVTAS